MTSWIKSVLYKFFVCVCVCIAMVVARMDLANKAMLYTLRVPPPGVKKTPYNVYPHSLIWCRISVFAHATFLSDWVDPFICVWGSPH